jgi:MarR family transcriptional regulator for hemolysin
MISTMSYMPRPTQPPVGLQLANTAKAVSRAFNDALAEAGGTLPVWLVLSSVKSEDRRTQLELARAVGIEGPTLTRHLDGLEDAGLVRRQRDAADRRAMRVELTEIAFNRRLTDGLSEQELDRLRRTLVRLGENVSSL